MTLIHFQFARCAAMTFSHSIQSVPMTKMNLPKYQCILWENGFLFVCVRADACLCLYLYDSYVRRPRVETHLSTNVKNFNTKIPK